MESIFHEKQEGYLCAQHCLNALLQGPYLNAVVLANFATQMDEEERKRMAESGTDSEEYKLFLEQPSGNMDDSGYFSVQVISSALKFWGLELIPYNSTESVALMAQNDPSQMKAYICNYKGHWFTIRKLGKQWFNLNSMLSGPQLISDTYLAMYLAQLLQEGYSIFIVIGTLPQCPAEEVLTRNPVVMPAKSKTNAKTETKTDAKTELSTKGYRLGTKAEDELLKTVGNFVGPSGACEETYETSEIYDAASYATERPRERIIPIRIEEREELNRAIALSTADIKDDDVDENLELRLDLCNDNEMRNDNGMDEEDELRKALQLSLECVTAPPTPDPEDLRWRRLNHFGTCSRPSETSQKLNT